MAIADAINGCELGKRISTMFGFSLEFVSEIFIYFEPDETLIYVWYNSFSAKTHLKYRFEQNIEFAELLCNALGIEPSNTQQIHFKIPGEGVLSGTVIQSVTMLATQKILALDWESAFTKGAIRSNDSTVARKDIDETVDIED